MSDTADQIMSGSAMKTALKTAQTSGKQVVVAVALDTDKNAVVLVAKQGKAMSLKKAFGTAVKKNKLDAKIKVDSQSLFYGYGTTDIGAEGILKLALNKTPPGGDTFAHKVFLRIKGAGFGKVVLSTNAAIDDEADEAEEAPDPRGAAPDAASAAPDAPPPLTEEQREVEAAQNRVHDPAKLKRVLGLLVQAMDKGNKQFVELAGAANAALNGNKLADAATAMARLKAAMDVAANTTAGKVDSEKPRLKDAMDADATAAAGRTDFEKPRLIWLATRKKAREGTDKLRARLDEHYKPQGIAPAIVASYDGMVGKLFGELDESLATTLDAAGAARQPEERARLVGEARAIIGRYEETVAGPVLAGLEQNPFEKLGLGAMLSASLRVLSGTIK